MIQEMDSVNSNISDASDKVFYWLAGLLKLSDIKSFRSLTQFTFLSAFMSGSFFPPRQGFHYLVFTYEKVTILPGNALLQAARATVPP